MKVTDNYKKHKSNNPVQKFLLENFYKNLVGMLKSPKGISHSVAAQSQHDKNRINSVLDAGCGEGFTLNRLSQNKIGQKLEGVDFSKDAISIGSKLHPYLSLKQGSIYDLPFKNNSFDLVLSTEVLEHLEKPEKALEEIIRVSKKYILLSVPNEPFFMLSNFLRGKNLLRFGNDIDHINHWPSRSFREFIKKEEVKIIKTKTPFPWVICLMEKI